MELSRSQETVEEKEIIELEPNPPSLESPVKFDNNSCTCCPYGYHVDVDFLRFCDALASGSYLKRLKKIKRTKRKLRKSMEIYLEQQALIDGQLFPDLMTSSLECPSITDNDSDSSHLLDEIDSSVNETVSSIDVMMKKSDMVTSTPSTFIQSSDDEDRSNTFTFNKFNTFPRETKLKITTKLSDDTHLSSRRDSASSISSASTISHPQTPNSSVEFSPIEKRRLHTVKTFAQNFSQPVPKSANSTLRSELPNADLSTPKKSHNGPSHDMEDTQKNNRRLRDLEEQVKAIPILQTRISVLKEEKRLLQLQMKAQQNKLNTRNVAISCNIIDNATSPFYANVPFSPKFKAPYNGSSPLSGSTLTERFDFMRRSGYCKPPAKLPSKEIGVGNHDISEPYILQPQSLPLTLTERRILNPCNYSEIMAASSPQLENSSELQPHVAAGNLSQSLHGLRSRTPVLNLSEGDAHKNESMEPNIHVYEKELKTLILGQPESVAGKRNVGVECRVPTRDVGVSYVFDETKPFMRSVGVGEDSIHEPKRIEIKQSDFRNALQEVLSKKVCSVGISCKIEKSVRSIGVMHSFSDRRSIGVSDHSVDVRIVSPRQCRSVDVSCKPDVLNVGCLTDRGWLLDASTNTNRIHQEHKYTSTQIQRLCNIATMTDRATSAISTQTESYDTLDDSAYASPFHSVDNSRDTLVLNVELSKNSFLDDSKDSQRGNLFPDETTKSSCMEPKNVSYDKNNIESLISELENDCNSKSNIRKDDQITKPDIVTSTTLNEHAGPKDKADKVPNSININWSSNHYSDNEIEMTEEFFVTESKVIPISKLPSTEHKRSLDNKSNQVNLNHTDDGPCEVIVHGNEASNRIYGTNKLSINGNSSSRKIGRFSPLSPRVEDTNDPALSLGVGNFLNEDSTTPTDARPLKSCMKRSISSEAPVKKEISFSHSIFSSMEDAVEAQLEHGEEVTDSDSDSASSYEEGSYDGREGNIVYLCKDDEIIASGSPGATMYDQNIRETFDISEEMRSACQLLANFLEDSTTIRTKELNSSLLVIRKEWFSVAGDKLSDIHQVEDHLSSFNEISRRLIQYIINMPDENGNTVLHYCVINNKFDLINLLLDTEVVNVDTRNNVGYSPLMLLSICDSSNEAHLGVIKRVFLLGEINAASRQEGETTLMVASRQGNLNVVRLLLECGADPNMRDNDGSTALMYACENGYLDVARLLINRPDCDVNIKDKEGSTAMSIAMSKGHKDIGVILYARTKFSKQHLSGHSSKKRYSPATSPTFSSSAKK